jgi:signal transduction histidine kinase
VANASLERNRAELEARVAERTAALRASQAREVQKEKMSAFGLLSAGIAHEVGNPLAALSSLVQMLQRRDPDPYTSEKLELAGRQLDRIRRTIRELVDFSRPASASSGAVRLQEVVDEALGIAKYYHRTRGRDVITQIPPDLPAVWAVKDHLTQVLLNLVINAIDATNRGGRIVLRGEAVDQHVQLEVADDGRGISPADREFVFKPHFTTKPNGTGLGLFVSRQMVEESGGTLDFVSTPGAGSTFTIRLPIHNPEPESANPARPALATTLGEPLG